jgi:hypothetical protein
LSTRWFHADIAGRFAADGVTYVGNELAQEKIQELVGTSGAGVFGLGNLSLTDVASSGRPREGGKMAIIALPV